jgi:hypothetical protein
MKHSFTLFALLTAGLLSSPSYAQQFAATPGIWSVPGSRFSPTDQYYPNAGLMWTTMDLTGDGYLDLVSTSTNPSPNVNEVYGSGTASPHWIVYRGSAAGFAATAVDWALPGSRYYMIGSYIYTGSSVNWVTMDMNGDRRPDLVCTNVGGGNSHWNVYLNTGTGFATTATSWALPAGGSTGLSFDYTGYYGYYRTLQVGDQQWSTTDVNGDRRPDLVVTSSYDGTTFNAFGTGTSRSWNVYLNTGTGFAPTATPWPLPVGGVGTRGFYATQVDNASGVAQAWALLDTDGDRRQDLVVLGERTTSTGILTPFTGPGGLHWNVYRNTGSGFATAPFSWALPAGGHPTKSFYKLASAYETYGNVPTTGAQDWTTLDVNNDRRPDLVVAGTYTGSALTAFGTGSNRYWNVYLGTTTGFAPTATTWTLPAGGAGSNSFGSLTSEPYSPLTSGWDAWSLLDTNGDGLLELVLRGQKTTDLVPYGSTGSWHWKTYATTGVVSATQPGRATLTCTAYPNPTTGTVTLTTPAALSGTRYWLRDALGRELTTGQFTAADQLLDLHGFAAGVYVLQLEGLPAQHLRLVKQ